MTAEAVEELDLKVGDEAVCVVKATNVIVEVPSRRSARMKLADVLVGSSSRHSRPVRRIVGPVGCHPVGCGRIADRPGAPSS